MTAAALGTTLHLPTLEADVEDGAGSGVETEFELEVRPGTQSGTEAVLRGSRCSGAAWRAWRPGRRHRRRDAHAPRPAPGGAAHRAGGHPGRGAAHGAGAAGQQVGVRPDPRRVQHRTDVPLMSLPVHLVPSLDGVGVGSTVSVEGDEAHHAVAVRRLRVGESVVLTDGRGSTVVGEVASTGKRVFEVTVASVSSTPAPEPAVTVVQAIPKGDRGELAVEVLTEVGVAQIVPVGGVARASRSGRASGPRSPCHAGDRPPARPPSSRAGRGSPRWPRSPRRPSGGAGGGGRPGRRAARGGDRVARVADRARRGARRSWSSAPRAG